MDLKQFEQLLRKDPRFYQLQANPQMLNEMLYKMSVILKSGKIKDEILGFLHRQRDLDRYTAIAKRVAGLNPQNLPWRKTVLDASLQNATDEEIISVLEDDARSFYYQLDVLTEGKHNFYEKANMKLAGARFKRGLTRSGVGCYEENGRMVWYTNIDCAPIINNRTVTMHELWHAMDEKNLNHLFLDEKDQFAGEIGSLFIDRLSYDFMMANHANDIQLIEGLKYLKSIEWNNDIVKGKEAYLDVLICQAFYGNSEATRVNAQQEILSGFGNMFGPNLLGRQIDKLYEVATNPHAHFDPMYELRYVVGRAVSDAVYNQDVPLSEKVDKMSELNDNVKSLNGIQVSQQQSPIDAITTHLGVDNIETLVDNYAQKMTQNRENQQLRQ